MECKTRKETCQAQTALHPIPRGPELGVRLGSPGHLDSRGHQPLLPAELEAGVSGQAGLPPVKSETFRSLGREQENYGGSSILH